ncbi:MAG: PAS domain-containing protein [Pedobacter sp.]|nr:MAG: PAS domain-containing protein [Pedobacter sp.]
MSTLFGVKNAEGTSRAMLFFETHPLPSFLVNRSNLRIVAVNKAGATLMQSTSTELQRLAFTDLLVNADKAKASAELQRSTVDSSWHTIVQVQKSNAEMLAAEMHVQTLINGNDVLHQIRSS